MKIRTNYDLMEEISLAKRGISLKRYRNNVLKYTAFGMTLMAPILSIDGLTKAEVLEELDYFLKIYTIMYGGTEIIFSLFEKRIAHDKLQSLANQLGNIYVDTNAEMLMDAKRYKTEYKLDFEQSPPALVQHKYIMVPVHNDWGNNERSLHQEHVIGTKDYDYSYGEPEKEKQYTYQMKRVINK